MITKTIYTDLEKLHNAGEKEASLIIRLMLACNDITAANHASTKFKEDELKPTQEHSRLGYRMYFVRLQIGHLNEAIKLINELSSSLGNSKFLNSAYEKCSSNNKDNYSKLIACLPNGSMHDAFKNNVSMLRNKTVFHYSERKLFEQAIADRLNRAIGTHSSITISDDIKYIRFNIADEIIDTVICRFLWNLDLNDADKLREEAESRGEFIFKLCVSFVEFCGDFILYYIREHGAG